MDIFGVSEKKRQDLAERMRKLGVREEDLEEKFIRSSGPGGQRTNKAATCVHLHHRPTGITVKCQQERFRAINRFIARRRLVDKLEEIQLGRLSAARQKREKIRRQKRRRSRRAKARMLDDKRKQSEKKKRRAPVRTQNLED